MRTHRHTDKHTHVRNAIHALAPRRSMFPNVHQVSYAGGHIVVTRTDCSDGCGWETDLRLPVTLCGSTYECTLDDPMDSAGGFCDGQWTNTGSFRWVRATDDSSVVTDPGTDAVTGPSEPFVEGQAYLVADTLVNGAVVRDVAARLVSVSGTYSGISFAWYMLGESIGRLSVQTKSQDGGTWSTVWYQV